MWLKITFTELAELGVLAKLEWPTLWFQIEMLMLFLELKTI
jgi:hypothetical protein